MTEVHFRNVIFNWPKARDSEYRDIAFNELVDLIDSWTSPVEGSVRKYADGLHLYLIEHGIKSARYYLPSILVQEEFPIDVIRISDTVSIIKTMELMLSNLDKYHYSICLALGDTSKTSQLEDYAKAFFPSVDNFAIITSHHCQTNISNVEFDEIVEIINKWNPTTMNMGSTLMARELGCYLASAGVRAIPGWMPRMVIDNRIAIDLMECSSCDDENILVERMICTMDLFEEGIWVVYGVKDPNVIGEIEDSLKGLFWDVKDIAVVTV